MADISVHYHSNRQIYYIYQVQDFVAMMNIWMAAMENSPEFMACHPEARDLREYVIRERYMDDDYTIWTHALDIPVMCPTPESLETFIKSLLHALRYLRSFGPYLGEDFAKAMELPHLCSKGRIFPQIFRLNRYLLSDTYSLFFYQLLSPFLAPKQLAVARKHGWMIQSSSSWLPDYPLYDVQFVPENSDLVAFDRWVSLSEPSEITCCGWYLDVRKDDMEIFLKYAILRSEYEKSQDSMRHGRFVDFLEELVQQRTAEWPLPDDNEKMDSMPGWLYYSPSFNYTTRAFDFDPDFTEIVRRRNDGKSDFIPMLLPLAIVSFLTCIDRETMQVQENDMLRLIGWKRQAAKPLG